MKRANFVIVGAGIVGCAIARELASRKAGSIIVLEKEPDLGWHASGRNSGVIHSGINQSPGSLKARMCVEGSQRLREYCRRKGISMDECGTLVVARSERELSVLDQLIRMGRDANVPNLSLLSRSQLQTKEPLAAGVGALLSPTGAVVDSKQLLESVADEAESSGTEFIFSCPVLRIDGAYVQTSQFEIEAGRIINCAGLYADRVAQMMNVGHEYRIIPFRGEYMEIKGLNVRTMIYPAPDLNFPFLGIHLTCETNGRVLAGPSAVLAFGREAYQKQWDLREMASMFSSRQFRNLLIRPEFMRLAVQNAKTSVSKRAFLHEIRTLIPSFDGRNMIPAKAGIRAQLVDSSGRMVNDLLTLHQNNATHILNAVSPGMTSSLAFAEYVVNQILD